MNYLAVALGGALGAMARFWVYNASVKWLKHEFPYATLLVNVLGSFAIGVFFVLIAERSEIPAEMRSFLVVGFLGAFTTFSTFSLDAVSLMQEGDYGMAFVYIVSSVLICLLAAWLGLSLARQIF